jgi:hypothetical protein
MDIRKQTDFGYIIDAMHFLKKPRRKKWIRRLDGVLAALIYYGFIVFCWWLMIFFFLWVNV